MDTNVLREQIKLNCTISDARFWGYYSICGLLMRLRELYRNEKSLMPWDGIRKEEMSEWIASRESQWKALENEDLRPLEIQGKVYDPFEVDGLNALLSSHGMVYGGGYGRFNKPTFFLARLEGKREYYDYLIHYTGREFSRDLSTSVAMLQGRCIFMRLEPLSALLWDKFQELRSRKFRGALGDAFSSRGIDGSLPPKEVYGRIVALSRQVSELFVRHEIGEAFEDEEADAWLGILSQNADRATEFYLRGIKDVLADSSVMGPLRDIIERRERSEMSFYMVFLDGIRKSLFPEIMTAFQVFTEGGNWSVLEEARSRGYARTHALRKEVVGLWKEGKAEKIGPLIQERVKSSPVR
ncbi:MAG: hypothetical protein M1497_13635 [Nitrospirae bacterium]|nr:hypothetical protein [Nitrospirota bacterium]